ncbi:MAG: hypothetical protein OXE44_05620 [Nitrospinae bacterium]|nr:hypothetical protein [Nitrospinota bacterium]
MLEETLSSTNTYTKQQWIAEQAREYPERVFTSLHHLIDGEWMREAYRRTRKDGARGIDGVSAADYEKGLETNLDDLLSRMKPGRYFAPPVRRHYIPKADGTKRPRGRFSVKSVSCSRRSFAVGIGGARICSQYRLPVSSRFGRESHSRNAVSGDRRRKENGTGDC